MKLVLAALAIVLVSALFWIGVTEISAKKGIESFEIGFHIRLIGKDLVKGADTHTIKEEHKDFFPIKWRKGERATISDSVFDLKFRGQLDSSMRDEQRKRELYIGRDTIGTDSSEFYKLNEK